MSTIVNKIQYTYEAVKDIRKALQEKGYTADIITLKEIGDIIRNLESAAAGSGIKVEFAKYSNISYNTYYAMPRNSFLNISTNIDISFTNNVTEIKEEE